MHHLTSQIVLSVIIPCRKKHSVSEDSIFLCIAMLATAVGQALTKHMHELLDLMFAFGLSSALHGTLVSLGKDIPALLPEIQGNLKGIVEA